MGGYKIMTSVNPTKSYESVFIFNIGTEIENRIAECNGDREKGVYETTRKYWAKVNQWQKSSDMYGVGLINGMSQGVFKISRWYETNNPYYPSRYEFDGIEQKDDDLFDKDWSKIIEPAKGFWQHGNWIVASFDGNGHFKILRGGGKNNKKWFSC